MAKYGIGPSNESVSPHGCDSQRLGGVDTSGDVTVNNRRATEIDESWPTELPDRE